jgi:hypothetical protein
MKLERINFLVSKHEELKNDINNDDTIEALRDIEAILYELINHCTKQED